MTMRRNYIAVCDAAKFLQGLESGSIHVCAGSPPYWGQRDYGVTGQMGLEGDLDSYIDDLVALYQEAWRVLRDDGVLFVNLGDRYAAFKDGKYAAQTIGNAAYEDDEMDSPARSKAAYTNTGLKNKDLAGLPWRFAIAMQKAGWWLRNDIIWQKPNGLPESVGDRFTRDHEYVFMFSKSGSVKFWTHRDHAGTRRPPKPDYRYRDRVTGEEVVEPPADWQTLRVDPDKPKSKKRWQRFNLWKAHDYYFDRVATATPAAQVSMDRQLRGRSDDHKYLTGAPGQTSHSLSAPRPNRREDADEVEINTTRFKRTVWGENSYDALPSSLSPLLDDLALASRLRDLDEEDDDLRTIWTIATEQLPYDHYAAFPTALVRPMILAGTPPKCCAACGAPYARVGEKTFTPQVDVSLARGAINAEGVDKPSYNGKFDQMQRGTVGFKTAAWLPTCDCVAADWERPLVLDFFMGSGTTALAALETDRDYVGCDLNPKYVEIARDRVLMPMFDNWDTTE